MSAYTIFTGSNLNPKLFHVWWHRILFVFVATLFISSNARATFLSVDFNNSQQITENGFVSLWGGNPDSFSSATYSTSEGNVTVTVSIAGGTTGFWNRDNTILTDDGAFTYAELYNDFVFSNEGGTISIDLSGPGILANVDYDITWYSLGNCCEPGPSMGVFQSDAASGTTGSTISYTWDSAIVPTSNDQFAYTGTWSSTAGTLGIDALWVDNGISPPGGQNNRVNGFQIAISTPEPTSLILMSLGLLGLGFSRRKKLQ
jgi:PEP-CTERM motif-containing protein